jgi:hypothetical protein
MPRGREISYELRCCIICLRFFLLPPRNRFSDIARCLDLETRRVQEVFQRARSRAGSDDFKEILACVGSMPRSGRPPRIVDGTQESHDIRTLILQLDDWQLRDVAHLWEQLTGKPLARSVIERVAHQHRDPEHPYEIVRGTRPLIPALSIEHFDDRDIFAQWAIIKIEQGAIFIFTDESAIEVGGKPRTKPKISRPRGQVDTFERGLPISKVQFKIMVWAATCTNWNGDFPIYCWDENIEDEKARQENARELAQENIARNTDIDEARFFTDRVPGSREANVLREINSNIQRENLRRRETGERGRLRPKTAAHIFPKKELTRDHKKNGIDWFLYRQKVCLYKIPTLLLLLLISLDLAPYFVSLLSASG